MATPPVTPTGGTNSTVTTGGTAVQAAPGGINGGYITNPATATEFLFVNPVGAAALAEGGTTFALQPGQSWDMIPGQTTPTSVNAATNGHVFSVVVW